MRKHFKGILRFIDCRLTNARLEGMNNKIRLLSHRAYGFHSADSLIATIYPLLLEINSAGRGIGEAQENQP